MTSGTKICLVCEGVSETDLSRCASCGLPLAATDEVLFPIRRGERDAAHPLLGALIDGTYRVNSVLGKGGMGTVFAAVHEVSLQTVALKILHPRYAARADHRRSFVEEARKAGRVIHEHSARVLDVGEDSDGTVYIAMELVEGATLADWIYGGEGTAPTLVIEILHQICRALAVAHDVGVVHRDLTPRNVMCLVHEGRPFVKILDFGIAKGPGALGLSDVPDPTGGVQGFANPPYSSPEHLEGKEVDARADLYSLGVIAYEALTRQRPVDGRTAREVAEATLEGRLRPLRAPAGTPRRLVRLVQRLLARDPDLRPASAREVIRELNRLRHPRSPLLRAVALLALLTSLPAFVLSYRTVPAPFMHVQGLFLALSDERPVPTDPAQELKRERLDELVFRFGGFRGSELELDAYYRDGTLLSERVAPRVDAAAGTLTLSTADSPSYAALLRALGDLPHDAVLAFRVPDQAPLRYAKVLVDDKSPEVDLRATLGEGGALNGDSSIDWTVTDKGTIKLELQLEWGSDEIRTIPVEERSVRRAGDLLPHVAGVAALTDVTLRLVAVDRAGNRADDALQITTLDLAAPAIVGVRGDHPQPRLVTFGPLGASVRVELDACEPGLVLVANPPGGDSQDVSLPEDLQEQTVRLQPFAAGNGVPYPNGAYTFRVRDAAGNRSNSLSVELRFLSEDPEVVLEIVRGAETGGRAEVVETETERQLVTDGAEVEVGLRCNAIYTPGRVFLLRPTSPVEFTSRELELTESANGQARFVVPPLEEGSYRLEIRMADSSGAKSVTEAYTVRAMPEPMALQLPDTSDVRFLRQLVELDVLTRTGEQLRQGPAWRFAGDVRLLQGRIWVGRRGNLASAALPPRSEHDSAVLPRFPLLRGENVVALELLDPLGRPVSVRCGERPCPTLSLPGGHELREVCRFVHQSSEPVLTRRCIEVEHGQPARIALLAPLPFRNTDRLHLSVRGSPLPVEVSTVEMGSLLQVRVAYDVLAAATGLDAVGPDAIAAGRDARLPATLMTPAGDYKLDLPVRTIRSSLRPTSWREIAGDRELDPALAGITMVPVLAPADGAWPDPVDGELHRRATFRPIAPIDVENVVDIFLQQTEITRRQYAALLRVAAALPAEVVEKARLVHAWDRAGPRRLAALTPLGFDSPTWRRALDAAPDRPVTGVSFFQAYTICRIAGLVVGGEPDLFRLPLGLDLEMAALGHDAAGGSGYLHGAGRFDPKATFRRLTGLGFAVADTAAWPPTAAQSRVVGDAVLLASDGDVVGLDFGVREWVLDLPHLAAAPPIVGFWLRRYDAHLDQAMAFARGERLRDSVQELERNGVVRGTPAGDPDALVDARTGRSLADDPDADLPPGVPGVVRALVVKRDGLALDELDPLLRQIGFRLAGGVRFVAEARR